MGAVLILMLFLSGCTTHYVYTPYEYLSEDVYAVGDTVYDHGTQRPRTAGDIQALQFVPDHTDTVLEKGELNFYYGTLYALSNYRERLLDAGFAVDSETRTPELLDTTLSSPEDHVRLIYQRSGVIRILFENQGGPAHILLEG